MITFTRAQNPTPGRRFGPKSSDHPSIGRECPACCATGEEN